MALTENSVETVLPIPLYFDTTSLLRKLFAWIEWHPSLALIVAHDTAHPQGRAWPEGVYQALQKELEEPRQPGMSKPTFPLDVICVDKSAKGLGEVGHALSYLLHQTTLIGILSASMASNSLSSIERVPWRG